MHFNDRKNIIKRTLFLSHNICIISKITLIFFKLQVHIIFPRVGHVYGVPSCRPLLNKRSCILIIFKSVAIPNRNWQSGSRVPYQQLYNNPYSVRSNNYNVYYAFMLHYRRKSVDRASPFSTPVTNLLNGKWQ